MDQGQVQKRTKIEDLFQIFSRHYEEIYLAYVLTYKSHLIFK